MLRHLPESSFRRRGRGGGWAAVSAVTAFAIWRLISSGTPVSAVLVLVGFIAWFVLLPGFLVHRGLRGPQSDWLSELSLAGATGIALGLAAWAAFSIVDARGLLWLWPFLTTPMLLRKRVRSRLRELPHEHWRVGPSMVVAAAAVAAIWHMDLTFVRVYQLPPSGVPYYYDLLWHMGLAQEATRAFPLGTPQLVGDGTLHYHWFSNAYLGGVSLITGLDIPTLILRLWVFPMAVLIVTLTVALTLKLSRNQWAASAAALAVQVTVPYDVAPGIMHGLNHFSGNSPSQYFAYPLMLLTVHALVDVARSGAGTTVGTFVIAGLGALSCAGAKASALPVILGGLGLASLSALALRKARATIISATVALALVTVLGMKFVSGGDAGSVVQFMSNLTWYAPYRELVSQRPDFATPMPTGLWNTRGVGVFLGLGLLVALLISSVRSLSFVLPLFQRRLRTDNAAWLLSGVCLSAFLPLFLLGHSGYSEYYFLYGTVPFGTALLMWSAAELVRHDHVSQRAMVVGGVIGGAAGFGAQLWTARAVPATDAAHLVPELKTLVYVAVGVGLSMVALLVVGALRPTVASRAARAVAVGLLLGPVVFGTLADSAVTDDPVAARAHRAPDPSLRAQTVASAWIRANIPPDDLTATNQHCLSGTGIRCGDARRWWISSLGGRRVLIEGWGYSPKAVLNKSYYDPVLYALNQRVFENPSPDAIAAVKSRGVRWLIAEAGPKVPVSPRIGDFADRKFSIGPITVYRLR